MLFDPTHGVTVVDDGGTHKLGRADTVTIDAGVPAPAPLVLRLADLYE